MDWQPIETAPTDEIEPFLVLLPGNDMCKTLAVQVSNFEGYMYPDCKDGIIDWEDHILGATHWSPLPAPPHPTLRTRDMEDQEKAKADKEFVEMMRLRFAAIDSIYEQRAGYKMNWS